MSCSYPVRAASPASSSPCRSCWSRPWWPDVRCSRTSRTGHRPRRPRSARSRPRRGRWPTPLRTRGHQVRRSVRHAPAVRGARPGRHRRGLRHDHEAGRDALDAPGSPADRAALHRHDEARAARRDLHGDLHGHARPLDPGGDPGQGRGPDHRADQRRHHRGPDLQPVGEAGAGAGAGGRGRAGAGRCGHVRHQRAAAPAHPRDERGRAEPDARLPRGGAARRTRRAAHAGRTAQYRADQRRRAGTPRSRRQRGGPQRRRTRPARPARRRAPRVGASGWTRSI